MMKQNRSTVWVWAPLVAWLACDLEEEVQDRDLVIVTAGASEGGADSGGDEGSDQAEEEWQEGEVQICEIGLADVEADAQFLEVEGDADLDDWTDAPDVAARAVACPVSGVASVIYVDWQCDDNGKLTCQHFCQCDSTYSSPCNPPHADCGGPDHRVHAVNTGHDMGPKAYCMLSGWAYCRKQTGLSAIQTCTAWCQQNTPARTRDCPDCAAK